MLNYLNLSYNWLVILKINKIIHYECILGAPADPFEAPIDSLPTEASAPVEEELPLAQYLPPSGREGRQGRQGRKLRRGRKRGGRRRKLGRRVTNVLFKQ